MLSLNHKVQKILQRHSYMCFVIKVFSLHHTKLKISKSKGRKNCLLLGPCSFCIFYNSGKSVVQVSHSKNVIMSAHEPGQSMRVSVDPKPDSKCSKTTTKEVRIFKRVMFSSKSQPAQVHFWLVLRRKIMDRAGAQGAAI